MTYFVRIIQLYPFEFPDKYLDFKLEWVDEFIKIVPSVFELFICHRQGLLACVKSVVVFFLNEFWKLRLHIICYVFKKLTKMFKTHLKKTNSLHMHATPDDGLWRVQKRSG